MTNRGALAVLPRIVRRSGERERLFGAIAFALLLHLTAVAAIRAGFAGKGARAPASRATEIEAPSLDWAVGEALAVPVEQSLGPSADTEGEATPLTPATPLTSAQRSALGAPGGKGAQRAERDARDERDRVPLGEELAQVESSELLPESARPVWTLDRLGVGLSNPFLDHAPAAAARVSPLPRSKAEAAQARLEASLRSSIARADAGVGISQGGALTASLRSAFTESSLLRSNLELVAEIDRNGQLLSLTSPASGTREIARAIERARSSLTGKQFKIPKGAAGLRVRLRVTVGVKLASGHDSGRAVTVFGIPLSKGAGANSSSIDFFPQPTSPRPNANPDRSDPLPPVSTLPVFGLHGDPSDIAAAAQRFVRATVVSEESL